MPGLIDIQLGSDSSSDSQCLKLFICSNAFHFYLVQRLLSSVETFILCGDWIRCRDCIQWGHFYPPSVGFEAAL